MIKGKTINGPSSIEVFNIIRDLHEICKRINNVIDSVIINKCQINRLWKRLNLFLREFEEVYSNIEQLQSVPNAQFKNVKNLFLKIASHIEGYVIYGPFKKLISNYELEKAFENFNSQLIYYSFKLGLRNLPYLNKSLQEMEDRDDREEDNEYYNNLLNSVMRSDARLLSFLGRVTEPEMIIEAISTLEDIINEDVIDPEAPHIDDLLTNDNENRTLRYSQSHSQEIISAIRNYKKPHMKRKKYANIDNIVYVCELLKKMAQGLIVEVKNWQIASWDIEIWEILSIGPFSKIYKAFWLGIDVAIKEMSYQINRVRVRKEFYKDVKMWYNLNHPNVLSLYGADQLGDYPFVVIPLMKNGNLINYIEGKEKLSLLKLIEILIGISSGMEYLHANDIVHGDLMARNILLDEELRPHICDFGFSKCRAVVDHHSKLKRLDSLRWTANEVHTSFVYTKKSDVYSFAMLCYELFTWGKVPFQNLSEKFLSEAVISGKRPEYPEDCPGAIWKLMGRMWDGNPENRPDFSDITVYLKDFKSQLKRQALDDGNSDDTDEIYSVYMDEIPSSSDDSDSDSDFDSDNKSNSESSFLNPRNQRSPNSIIDDGIGSDSIDLNSNVSPMMSHTKYSPHRKEVAMPGLPSSNSVAIPYMKNGQGRKIHLNNNNHNHNNNRSQGQGQIHPHSLSGSFTMNHSNYSHSPSNQVHPIQLTSEMLPERLSSKHSNPIKNNIGKSINVVQSGYRQRSSSSNSNQKLSSSPNMLSPTTQHASAIRMNNGSSSKQRVSSSIHSMDGNNQINHQTKKGYDFTFTDIDDEEPPANLYITRADREILDQKILNELSLSEEEDEEDPTNYFVDEYYDNYDDDYIEDTGSQPTFNEMEDNHNYRIQKMFEDEFELTSLYDNENDEHFHYLYQVDDKMLKEAYANFASSDKAHFPIQNHQTRRSSQNQGVLSIDTARRSRSRSRSRSHLSAGPDAHGYRNSRSDSRSKSRTRSNLHSNGRHILEMETLDGSGKLTPSPVPRKISIGKTLSSEANAAAIASANYQNKHQSQSQAYKTPPASRTHSPYNEEIKEDEGGVDGSSQGSHLQKSMNNMKIIDELESNRVSPPKEDNSYLAPPISDRTEGVYRLDYRKDITFSFMDDEDMSTFYPKDEYCLSNLSFPDIDPKDVEDHTFTSSFIDQVCLEIPLEPPEKKDFAREMLLGIYMREFRERFGEFKFNEIFRRNRIEFNTYGFSDWSYKRSAYKVLIDIIKYTHIHYIYIRNCRFGDPAIVALAKAFIKNNEFTFIDITFCSKRSRPQQENNVLDIIKYDASNLDPSWILNNNVTAKSGQLFATLVNYSENLRAIHLRNAAFGNDCALMMAEALRTNKSIEDFELCNCLVGETAGIAFADMLKENKVLLRLILQQNDIGDKGAIAISSALRTNMTLKYLLLQRCGLSSKAMSAFTPTFLNNLGLELVKFSSNNIGNEGARAIAEGIIANSNIKQLWIDDCNISKKGVQAISRSLDQNIVTEIHVGSVFKFWEKKIDYNPRIIIHRDLFS